MFAGDFLDLVEQRGGFSRTLQHGLVLLEPHGAFLPESALLNVKLLDLARVSAGLEIRAGLVERTQDLAPDVEVQKEEDAAGQGDLVRYLHEQLARDHQVVYTTHSPFMVDAAHLHRTRTVEDVDDQGTKVRNDLDGVGRQTLRPLVAAVGYQLARTGAKAAA